MPTYEYSCKACGKKFSLTMGIAEHDRKRPACPKCGNRSVAQRFSGFFSKTARKS
ncbi:MAG TPA: FmdB family zinc ribbon protein [Candidatus Methanoperedens sp.]|nr:FmdB family zinc ribbon protein [Candidatus Methanoperedens sp.]